MKALNEGVALFNGGDFAAALARFKEAAKQAPRDKQVQLFLGHTLKSLGRLREAEAVLRRAGQEADRRPRNAAGLFDAARREAAEHWSAGRVEDAAAALERALRLKPEDASVREELVLAYTRLGRDEEAGELLAAPGAGPLGLLQRGEWLSKRGRGREAAKALAAAADAADGTRDGWLASLRARLLLGRFESAFELAERILDADRSMETLEGLINRLADWPGPVAGPGLVRKLEAWSRSHPESPWPVLLLSDVLEKTGRQRDALALTERFAGFPRRYGWMRYVRGRMLLAAEGRRADAGPEFAAAYRSAPKMWQARAHQAELALCAGDAAGAFRAMKSLAAGLEGMDLAQARAWHGALRLWHGDYAGALKELDAAVRGGAPFAPCWRGGALLKLGRRREALEVLDGAVRLNPLDAEALVWRGEARRLAGDAAGARADLEAALALGSENRWARANLELLEGRSPAAERLLERGRGVRRPELYLDAVWAPHLTPRNRGTRAERGSGEGWGGA